MAAYFGIKLYFCQSLIAGAILSGEYSKIVICVSSQYGKSWLMGHIALLQAYFGHKVYIAGGTANVTSIIMGNVHTAMHDAAPEIMNALVTTKNEADRLTKSISKDRIAFPSSGGFVETLTLAATYADNISSSGAVGRAGDFIVDEAANIPENALSETGRREFASVTGESYPLIMISNPHKPGFFWEHITEENPADDTFILWADALTAVEEERWSKEKVFRSDFARNRSDLRRYLLCVLDVDGSGMFDTPKLYDAPYHGEYTQYFMGIDAAYKGKDNICVSLVAAGEDGKLHVEDIASVKKDVWIDGVTPKDIVRQITKWCREFNVAFVCVDVGWGVWLVQGLIDQGINVLGVNFAEKATPGRVQARHYAATNAANVRAEMHLDLQNLIEEDAIEFDRGAYEKVKDILPLVVAERKANGKIAIRPKSEVKAQIGKSPDELDAVLLAIHAVMIFGGM